MAAKRVRSWNAKVCITTYPERIKDAERKRREKMDDIAAKARVKAQIEEDRKARAEKAAHAKAMREGTALPGAAQTPAPPPAAPRASTATEARLRVRAPGGQWTGTMAATATLTDVESAVLQDGKGGGASTLQFSTTFPRKTYSAADRSATLKELGLVPSAALEASSA